MIYDTIIIGGGPTGSTAAIYAARKQLKALLIAQEFGGQSVVSNDIGNWIGDVSISGFELAQRFEKHVRAQTGLDILTGEKVTAIDKIDSDTPYPIYKVTTETGKIYETKTLILGMGAHRRKLGVPGEKEFNAKGVAYCATCDAPFFGGKKVAVVGGGNSGLESAEDLCEYAEEVYLFNRTSELKGDPVTVERLRKHPKFKGFIHNTVITAIKGGAMMQNVDWENLETKETGTMPLDGLFIEIGSVPSSEMVAHLVTLNDYKEIIIDHKYASTSAPGIFAAGDITDEAYKQNNISAGDAVKAALSAQSYLQGIKKHQN